MNQDEINLLMSELLIRVGAIERLIVAKGVCTVEDLNAEIKSISESVIKLLESKNQN